MGRQQTLSATDSCRFKSLGDSGPLDAPGLIAVAALVVVFIWMPETELLRPDERCLGGERGSESATLSSRYLSVT